MDEFRLNRKDITFSAKGDSWILYSGSVAKNLITWSSSNESVATFDNGTVVAVGSGTTEVHAEYNGQKISCIIRCNFQENAGVAGSGGGVSEDGGGAVTEDGGNTSSGTETGSCAIYTQYGGGAVTDITLKTDEKVGLVLKDAAGNTIQVTWSVSGNGCTVSGNTVTGSVSGSVNTVSATYNGVTYSCTIRVS